MEPLEPSHGKVERERRGLVDLRHVQSFRAGQAVPEWLLFLEPKSPSANRGTFCFAADADLYEKQGRYWLLPADPLTMQFLFAMIGTQNCTLIAGSQQTSWPAQIMTARSADGKTDQA
nr:hypothetical protein [Mesorhizobium loti]